jgi:hypothetical protein
MDGTGEWVVEGTTSYLATLSTWVAEFRRMDTWVSDGGSRLDEKESDTAVN